jgi:hypothetical protein
MSEGYKIPIDLSALDEMIKKIEAAAEVVKSLDTNVRGLNNSMKSFGGGGGGGGRKATGGNGGIPGMVNTGPTSEANANKIPGMINIGGYDVSFREPSAASQRVAEKYQSNFQKMESSRASASASGITSIDGYGVDFRQQTTGRFKAAQQYAEARRQFLAGKNAYKSPIGPDPFAPSPGFIGPMPILPEYARAAKGYSKPIGPEPEAVARTLKFKPQPAPASRPAPTPRTAPSGSAGSAGASAAPATPSPRANSSASTPTIAMQKPLGGPHQNLQQAQQNLQNLLNQGANPMSPAVQDAQIRVHRAQLALQNAMNAMNATAPTAYRGMSRVISRGAISLAQAAISSSGMGGAAGLAANAGLYGLAALGAPYALAGAAVIGTAAFGYYGGVQGSDRRNLGYNVGGSLGQVAGIQAMGAGGSVAQFGETLRQGGIAGAYFRRKGLRDLGEIQTNKGANYIRALEILREEKDPGMREIVMREAGFANQSAYVNASPETFNRFKESMERAPVDYQSIADAEVEMDIAKKTISDHAIVVGGGMAKGFNRFIKTMSDPNKSIAEKAITALKRTTSVGLIIDFFNDIRPTVNETKEANRRWKTQSDKQSTNYDPLNERIPKNEIVGGGSRAQSSVNIGQSVAAANSYGLQEQIRLGAFPVY